MLIKLIFGFIITMPSTSFCLWRAVFLKLLLQGKGCGFHPAFSYEMNAFPVRNFQQGQSSLFILGPTWHITQLTFVF